MDSSKKPEKTNPRENANPLSQILFLWIVPLLFRGARNGLNPDDLSKCLPADNSENLGDKLERYIYSCVVLVIRQMFALRRHWLYHSLFLSVCLDAEKSVIMSVIMKICEQVGQDRFCCRFQGVGARVAQCHHKEPAAETAESASQHLYHRHYR